MSSLQLTSLEEFIMLTMWDERKYGLEIVNEVSLASEGLYEINIGSLYPALKRLEQRGFLRHEQVQEDLDKRNGHSRKYYRLTPCGREILCSIERVRQQLRNVQPVTS